MDARAQLAFCTAALASAERGDLPVDTLAAQVRANSGALLQALPDRFGIVLADLLTRLESAASFTDEACAISQRDLLAGLRQWVDKAAGRLG